MAKNILFEESAANPLQLGINKLTRAVAGTMGPKGKTVLIERGTGDPQITKDGVTVASEVTFPDYNENLGADLIKSVSERARVLSGDGTTAATVLGNEMINRGYAYIDKNPGASVHDIKKGMDKATALIVENLKEQSRPTEGIELLTQIATISANGDKDLGRIIAEAYDYVGAKGIVIPEESHSHETQLIKESGIMLETGYVSSWFQNTEKQEVHFNNPRILITDMEFSDFGELSVVMEQMLSESSQPIVVICRNMEGEALTSMVHNKISGGIPLAAIYIPHVQCGPNVFLNDLASALGGEFLSTDTGQTLSNMFGAEVIGTCAKIIIGKDMTKIISPGGDIPATISRIERSGGDQKTVDYRANVIGGKTAIIKLGGVSRVEYKEKLDRFDDSISATKAAIEEGYVVGSGKAFINARINLLVKQGIQLGENPDIEAGAAIVFQSVLKPFWQIMRNSNMSEADIEIWIEKFTNAPEMTGVDCTSFHSINLEHSGIIDPTKVVRVALESASSVASTVLSTFCVITRIRGHEV